MRTLLKHRDFRLYAVGQTLSSLGSSSLWMAAAIWVHSLTGSAGAAGLVMFFFGASAIAAPALGLVVDRVRRLRLLIGVNLLGVALVSPLLFPRNENAVWTVFAVMFAYGLVNRIVTSAQTALLPDMIADDMLADANGMLRSLHEAMRIAAPMLGAGLFIWKGIAAVVILDMTTFLCATGLFWLLRTRLSERKPAPAEPGALLHVELMAGIRYLISRPTLRALAVGATVAALVFGFGESGMFAVATEGLDKPSAFVGVIGMAQGVGSVVVGGFTGWIARRIGEVRLVAVGLAGYAASMLLLIVPSTPTVLAAVFLAGLALPLVGVGAVTCLQRHSPDNLRGRAYSGFDMAITAASTMSVALGAALVSLIGYQAMFLIATAVLAIGAFIVLTGGTTRSPAAAGPAVTPVESS